MTTKKQKQKQKQTQTQKTKTNAKDKDKRKGVRKGQNAAASSAPSLHFDPRQVQACAV
jgi:hypothetical protein